MYLNKENFQEKFASYMYYGGKRELMTYSVHPISVKVWTEFCQTNGIKLGRWADCKYCNSTVLPLIGDGVVVCSNCGYGIGDLTDLEQLSWILSNPTLPDELEVEMPDLRYLEEVRNDVQLFKLSYNEN